MLDALTLDEGIFLLPGRIGVRTWMSTCDTATALSG